MKTTDFRSSPFVAYPFEQHEFRGDANAFECSVCHRPRAMHLHDGFVASQQTENVGRWFKD